MSTVNMQVPLYLHYWGGGYETCTILVRRRSPARTTLGFFETPSKKVLDIECHI